LVGTNTAINYTNTKGFVIVDEGAPMPATINITFTAKEYGVGHRYTLKAMNKRLERIKTKIKLNPLGELW